MCNGIRNGYLFLVAHLKIIMCLCIELIQFTCSSSQDILTIVCSYMGGSVALGSSSEFITYTSGLSISVHSNLSLKLLIYGTGQKKLAAHTFLFHSPNEVYFLWHLQYFFIVCVPFVFECSFVCLHIIFISKQ